MKKIILALSVLLLVSCNGEQEFPNKDFFSTKGIITYLGMDFVYPVLFTTPTALVT